MRSMHWPSVRWLTWGVKAAQVMGVFFLHVKTSQQVCLLNSFCQKNAQLQGSRSRPMGGARDAGRPTRKLAILWADENPLLEDLWGSLRHSSSLCHFAPTLYSLYIRHVWYSATASLHYTLDTVMYSVYIVCCKYPYTLYNICKI